MAPHGLIDDVRLLAATARDSAGPGERGSAAFLERRLRATGAQDVAVHPYRGRGTYAWSHAVAYGLGLWGARRGGVAGRVAALGGLVHLELDASGRAALLDPLLARGDGATVVGRVAPADGAPARRTFVVVAHHDAARTGLVWSPRVVEPGARRRLATRTMQPLLALPALALALVAVGGRAGRVAGGALNALGLLAMLDVGTSRTVPGANDNATGVAAALALAERVAADPLPDAELLVILPGGEESGMGGMRAFLRETPLDPATTFVLGLDTLGSGTPIVLDAERSVTTHRYSPRDVELVLEGARRAGVAEPERWTLGGWTDPVLALHAGLRCTCLLSRDEKGHFGHYHHPSDLPEHVDAASFERCLAIAEGTARAFAAQG